MKRVNHSVEFVSEDGACTNQAESYFARLRRSEFGIHHRISGHLLQAYANEMAWRETGVTAYFSLKACGCGSPTDHPVDVNAVHRQSREDAGFADRRAEEGRAALIADAGHVAK